MWSAPHNFDFHSNWLGIGITKKGLTNLNFNKDLFEAMHAGEHIHEFEDFKFGEYRQRTDPIIVECADIQVLGTMGRTHTPKVTIAV